MARLKSELEVVCPCCETTLVIDTNLGRVVSHKEPDRGNKPELSQAQRILAEAMARELGPKGVHVAYVMIDAVIDLEWTRKRWPDAPDDFFITPAAIAEEVWHVAHQDRRMGQQARSHPGSPDLVQLRRNADHLPEVLSGAVKLRSSKRRETWPGPSGEPISVVLSAVV